MSKKKDQEVDVVEEKLTGGALLKSVRTEKGISLETVHDATKIPMDALRAIEEGYTVRTLTPFYMKGFLKIYAQYLDVEVSEVVEDYRSEKLPPYIKKDVHEFDIVEIVNKKIDKTTKQKIFIVCAYILCFFLIFKVITFFTHGKEKEPQEPTAVQTQSADLIAKEEKLKKEKAAQEKQQRRVDGQKKLEAKRKKEEQERKKAAEERRKQAAAVPAVKPKQPETVTRIPVENAMDNVTLTVRAKKNSWLRVSADGNIVFQSTLRLGSVETWMAEEKIEISGKNINSLEFELNGKMIGTLGREDRKAKKLVVTKDGLTVTQ